MLAELCVHSSLQNLNMQCLLLNWVAWLEAYRRQNLWQRHTPAGTQQKT